MYEVCISETTYGVYVSTVTLRCIELKGDQMWCALYYKNFQDVHTSVWAAIVDVWVWCIWIQLQHNCIKLSVAKSAGLLRCSYPHVHVSSYVNCTITKMLFRWHTASSALCTFRKQSLGKAVWKNLGLIPLWKHWWECRTRWQVTCATPQFTSQRCKSFFQRSRKKECVWLLGL